MPTSTGRSLRIAVLGPVQAWRGDEQLDLGPVRQHALLAALVLRPDTTVGKMDLLDGLWGLEPPGTGVKMIPVYVYRLRKCLRVEGEGPIDSVIASDQSGYRFISTDVQTDVAQLAAIVAEAGAARDGGDLAAAAEGWSKALQLFRGEPLVGLPGPFAQGQRMRLTEHRISLWQEKLECQLQLGEQADAVGELVALTATYPHSEALAALLMRALYSSNRQADALAVFTEVRRRLVDDLGVEPGDELRRVHQAVLRGDDALLLQGAVRPESAVVKQQAANSRAGRQVRNELPADVGSLTGRTAELDLLLAPADPGMVTVAAVDGMAGVGKTALVVRAARLLHERYPDGCVFVDLHGHREGRDALVPQRALRRLLRAVGADEDETDDLDELTTSWRTATASLRLLLVIDDAAGAEQTRPLLPAGAGSLVLVTSRQRLGGLDVDRRISLEPLGLDEAAGLLARIVGGSRTEGEQAAVRELARLCDQLPLALRIVGARMQNRPKWTFENLVARLADEESRLSELTAEDRSVEAAFQLSYDQLPPVEQHAFRALGLSPTVELDRLALAAMLGCSPQDAEQALESLVDASLVQPAAADRYRLHDLVAVYARRLAAAWPEEVAAARIGAFRLYLAAGRCTSDWGPGGFPTGPELGELPFDGLEDAAAWLDTVGGELTDVVGHAVAVEYVDEACWIAEGLVDYLTRQGRHHECRAAIETALSRVDDCSDQRMATSLRTCLGISYGLQGIYGQSQTWLEESLAIGRLSGDLREQARALGALGNVTRSVGQTDTAVVHLTEVAQLAVQLDDDWLNGMATCNLGAIHYQQGRYEEALDCFGVALALAEKIGSPRMVGKTLAFIADVRLDLRQYAEAAAALRQAIGLAEQVADVLLYALCLTRLGTAEQGLGDLTAALELHRRALSAMGEQSSLELELEIRNRLGRSLLAASDFVAAWEQFALVLARTEAGHSPEERARAVSSLSTCEPALPAEVGSSGGS